MAMAGGLPPGWTPTALHLDSLLASVTKGCAASARQALPVAGRQPATGLR
jgi:hypothetical protein